MCDDEDEPIVLMPPKRIRYLKAWNPAREQAYEAMRAALELAKPVLADRAVGGRQLRPAAEAREVWEAADRALALAEQADA